MAHTFNAAIQEAEIGGSLNFKSPWSTQFQASQDYLSATLTNK